RVHPDDGRHPAAGAARRARAGAGQPRAAAAGGRGRAHPRHRLRRRRALRARPRHADARPLHRRWRRRGRAADRGLGRGLVDAGPGHPRLRLHPGRARSRQRPRPRQGGRTGVNARGDGLPAFGRRAFLQLAAGAMVAAAAPGAWAGARLDAVLERLRGFVEAGALPFASIRIARHGEVLSEAHIGGVEPVDAHSLHRIYSMTKPVVAAATVLLVEDGSLSLHDPVARYVPEFAGLRVLGADGATVPARPMTVAHLLSHSCGLANSWGDSPLAPRYREVGLVAARWMYAPRIRGLHGYAARLGRVPLAFQPGSAWLGGYGLDIAGLVVERVSGQRLGDFLRERVFAPLGVAATGFHVPVGRAGHLAGSYAPGEGGLRRIEAGSARRRPALPFAHAGRPGRP